MGGECQDTGKRRQAEHSECSVIIATDAVFIITKMLMNRPWLQMRNRRPKERGRSQESEPTTDPEYNRAKRNAAEEMPRLTDFQAEVSGLQ